MDISDFVPLVATIGIVSSSFAAVYILNENHKWNRRQHAALLLSQWDDKMSEHRKGIERIKPGLLDLVRDKQVEITLADATKIYQSEPNTPEWELRFHFIQVLNFAESIASAYIYHVGDREMLEKSFKSILLKHYDMLRNFIKVVSDQRGYQGWEPFTDLMSEWGRKPLPVAKKTG